MKSILLCFCEFRIARKYIGGTWYKVSIPDHGGWSSAIEYWTRNLDGDETILTIENY